MIKLALLGRGIQHSRSPEIYQRLLVSKIHYDLLDYPNPSLIPKLEDIFSIYDGISITSPYKRHFLDKVKLTEQAQKLGAINCIRQNIDGFHGENTDYSAIVEILKKLRIKHDGLQAIILGDGAMSNVTQVALQELGIDFNLYARKITNDFDRINLTEAFSNDSFNSKQKIVINTCSRDYIFKGIIDKETIFWDFNYSFSQHAQILPAQTQYYMDGIEMLELQAIHALHFWSINTSDF